MPDRAGLRPAKLFLALSPPEPVRRELAAAGRELGERCPGRSTRPDTIHMTLVFIGQLARERVPALIEALAAIRAPALCLELDRTACWRPAKVAVLQPGRPPQALFDLVAALETCLADLAIAFDRRPYRPHVTLIRKADCAKANPAQGRVSDSPVWGDVRPIVWSVERFVLLESVPTPAGVRYDELGSFALL